MTYNVFIGMLNPTHSLTHYYFVLFMTSCTLPFLTISVLNSSYMHSPIYHVRGRFFF